MKPIRLFDAFAGVSAIGQSLKELGVPYEVVATSEIDADALISNAVIHIDNFEDEQISYPEDQTMRDYLMSKNVGYDYAKSKSSIPRMNKVKLRLLYKSDLFLNNLGDVSMIDYEAMPDFDLMNLSFACTDISNAGKQKGFINVDGSPTRSGLVIYGLKAIKTKKPKYVMIENVKGLIQKKFLSDFYSIVREIEDMGYKCYYPTKTENDTNPTCLNAKDFGIPQHRERVYVICIRNDIETEFKFPKGFESNIKFKDILEDSIDDKYYLSVAMKRYILDANNVQMGTKWEGRADNDVLNPNIAHTISVRGAGGNQRAGVSNFIIDDYEGEILVKQIKKENYDNIDNLKIRKLSPLECFRLMGFPDYFYTRPNFYGIKDSQLYKLSGNSICVPVLYYIFKSLFKDYMIGDE